MAASTTLDKGGIALAEEAVAVLLHSPWRAVAAYFIGSVPFASGCVVFGAAMSQSAHAAESLPVYALAMTLLFVWMKAWQTRFAREQLAWLEGRPCEPWTLSMTVAIAARQALLHAGGVIAIPFGFLVMVPFPWIYAAYQHATVIDDSRTRSLRALAGIAIDHAQRWPRQNAIIVWLLCPLTVLFLESGVFVFLPTLMDQDVPLLGMLVMLYSIVFTVSIVPLSPFVVVLTLNVIGAMAMLIFAVNTFLGVETIFHTAPGAAMNSTLVMMGIALTYLCIDPIAKTAYVLRTFYAQSRSSGLDLQLAVKRLRMPIAGLFFALIFCTGAAHGQTPTPSVDSVQLRSELDRVFAQPDFEWRAPRTQIEMKEGPVTRFLKAVEETITGIVRALFEWIERIMDWIYGKRPGVGGGGWSMDSVGVALRTFVVALGAILACVLVWFLWTAWRARPAQILAGAAPQASLPDIAAESTTADELPEEEWLALAARLMAQGESRLAARAFFLALLAALSRRALVRIARAKTNLEYARELARYAHVHPALPPAFAQSARLYEDVWYGDYPATPECLARLQAHQAELAGHA